jgi:hypothetical protein
MKKVAKATLHFPGPGHDRSQPAVASGRLPSETWITDEFLAETQRHWSEAYGRLLSADEALEILRNVKGVADVLWDIIMRKRMAP